jgi:hypothetical protein
LAIYVNLLDGLNAVLLCMGIFLIGNYWGASLWLLHGIFHNWYYYFFLNGNYHWIVFDERCLGVCFNNCNHFLKFENRSVKNSEFVQWTKFENRSVKNFSNCSEAKFKKRSVNKI